MCAASPEAMELSSQLAEGIYDLQLTLAKCSPPEPAAQGNVTAYITGFSLDRWAAALLFRTLACN